METEIDSAGNTDTAESDLSGNTKRPNQLMNWFMTWNNYKDGDMETLFDFFVPLCRQFAFQEEIGQNGTPHLQGCFSLLRPMRWTEFNLCRRIHWERVGDLRHSLEYCTKDDTRKPGTTPRCHNYTPKESIKLITELYPWQQKCLDIYLTEPDNRKVYWFWEKNGNVGKSAFVKYMVMKHKCLFCDGGKKADLINLVFKANMFNTKGLFWDIPRVNRNKISYSTIEAIKNGLICNTKYETGVKAFNPPHVFIFANFAPNLDDEGLSADRWIVTEL